MTNTTSKSCAIKCSKVGPAGAQGATGPDGPTGPDGATGDLQLACIENADLPLDDSLWGFTGPLIGTLLIYGGPSGPSGTTGLAVGVSATVGGAHAGALAFRFVDGGALFDSIAIYS